MAYQQRRTQKKLTAFKPFGYHRPVKFSCGPTIIHRPADELKKDFTPVNKEQFVDHLYKALPDKIENDWEMHHTSNRQFTALSWAIEAAIKDGGVIFSEYHYYGRKDIVYFKAAPNGKAFQEGVAGLYPTGNYLVVTEAF